MTFEELHKNYTRPTNICGIYKLAKDNQKQKEKAKVLKKIK